MPIDARGALAENLLWLKENTVLDSQAKIAARAKLDQKTVGRMLNNANAATLASIQALAKMLKVEPWQLLAPEFGAGLHTLTGKALVPADRPTVEAKPPVAGKDELGLPLFKVPALPKSAPVAEKAPRAGKRPSDAPPKRGARAGR